MHLPGPLRAAVGLAATAVDEVRHLPDRALELPMLAVSTALQVSVRAQQRYAGLTARGDEALGQLGRSRPTDAPPAWATFDDPLAGDDLRRAAGLTETDGAGLFADIFGVDDPDSGASDDAAGHGAGPDTGDGPAATAGEAKSPAAKAAPKSPRKAAASKASRTAAGAAPAKRTSAARTSAPAGKTVRAPRHTAPSRFDAAGDEPSDEPDGTGSSLGD